MVIRKILENTLSAGSTTISFTDTDMPNSLIRVYNNNPDVFPIQQVLQGNTLTLTYSPQTDNIDVAVEIVKQGLDIVDNVTSTDTDKALSANQGKVLKDAIDTTNGNLSDLATVVDNLDIPDNITDLNDVDVTDIENNQVLAWNALTEKFENVDQSGGGGSSISYSTTEYKIGTWIDGSDAYQCVVDGLSVSVPSAGSWSSVFADSLNIKTIIDAVMIDNTNSTNPILLAVEQVQVLNGGVRIQKTTNTLTSRVISRCILTYTKNS